MSNVNNDPNFISLRKIAPYAKLSVLICSNLHCTNHYDINTTIYIEDRIDNDWLYHLSCSVCNNTWAICTKCNKFKNKMTNNRMISMHRSQHHGKSNKRVLPVNDNISINSKKQKSENILINEVLNNNDKLNDINNNIINQVINNHDNELITIDNTQLDFDITIGSSIVEQENINIDNNNNKVIEIHNDKIIEKEKDQNNLLKEEKEAIKIASIVSTFKL